MSNPIAKTNYRVLYGKLFSALIKQFGVNASSEIEDAIQNSFLKSIKYWTTQDSIPQKKENWLFITAKNDVLNQLKKKNKFTESKLIEQPYVESFVNQDLRLDTILLVAVSKTISKQAKVIFVLKTIFGLSVSEISTTILISIEAVYKSVTRAKKQLIIEFENEQNEMAIAKIKREEIEVVEEILYSVFNVGFDSFNLKNNAIVDKDICLEALSLTKALHHKYLHNSTSNLLSLICFHSARIPAKICNGHLVSFFKQDRTKWNNELLQLGFYYLKKPITLSKYYIEALIVSCYMTEHLFTIEFWNTILNLYELLLKISDSPIIKLNYCLCLIKANRREKAQQILNEIEKELPENHFYLLLVKANIDSEINKVTSEKNIAEILNNITQDWRKKYILENNFLYL